VGHLVAVNCVFTNNYAKECGGAIEIVCLSASLDRCSFINNTAGHGGAVCVTFGILVATNTTFYRNKAAHHLHDAPYRDHGGGAICLFEGGGARAYLYHCTIDQNESIHDGGGIHICSTTALYMYNCIVTGNTYEGVPSQILLEQGGTFNRDGRNLIQGEN